MRQRVANRLTFVLLGACAAAGGWLAWSLGQQETASVRPLSERARAAMESEGARTPVAGPARAVYEEILARPLFEDDRKPRADSLQATGEATGSAGNTSFRLEGVAIGEGQRVAVIRRLDNQMLLRLRQGERIGQWALEVIRPDRVVLRSGATVQVLALSLEKARGHGGDTGSGAAGVRSEPRQVRAPVTAPSPPSEGRGTQPPQRVAADPRQPPPPAPVAPAAPAATNDPDLEGIPAFDPFGAVRAQGAQPK